MYIALFLLVLHFGIQVQVLQVRRSSKLIRTLIFWRIFTLWVAVKKLKFFRSEHESQALSDDGQGSHEEGEHHGRLFNLLQSVQDGQAKQLHKGVEVHTAHGQLLNVLVLRIVLGFPDHPQEQSIKEVVARQRGNAHVEEDTLKNGTWQELQHRSQEQGYANQHVNQEVGGTLFHHLHWDLALALWKLLHLVSCQGDNMGDAWDSGSH
mmetsp:Transcript_63803/g.78013  ORF Transcript_63803/g.78013 Transcript_63803/m.78013 type:complete len:208 (-) Transcript_63803:1165-1788(-)